MAWRLQARLRPFWRDLALLHTSGKTVESSDNVVTFSADHRCTLDELLPAALEAPAQEAILNLELMQARDQP